MPDYRLQSASFHKTVLLKSTHKTQGTPPYAPAADFGRLLWNLPPLLASKASFPLQTTFIFRPVHSQNTLEHTLSSRSN